jgi:hypothetical protein
MNAGSSTVVATSSISTLSPSSCTRLAPWSRKLKAASHTHQTLKHLSQVNREQWRATAASESATRAAGGGDPVQTMGLVILRIFCMVLFTFSLFCLVVAFAGKSASPASGGFTNAACQRTLTARTLLCSKGLVGILLFFL